MVDKEEGARTNQAIAVSATDAACAAGGEVAKAAKFLPFKKVLVHARSLKLKSQREWAAWRMSGARRTTFPPPRTKHTRTTAGKGGGTGWSPATLACQKTTIFCRWMND